MQMRERVMVTVSVRVPRMTLNICRGIQSTQMTPDMSSWQTKDSCSCCHLSNYQWGCSRSFRFLHGESLNVFTIATPLLKRMEYFASLAGIKTFPESSFQGVRQECA